MLDRNWLCIGLSLAFVAGCHPGQDDADEASPVAQVPECADESGKPKPTGPNACGSIGCADGEVCVESARSTGDHCLIYFCVSVPEACEADPTCACLADFTDYTASAAPICRESDGDLVLSGIELSNPPWTEPACPGATCAEGEKCWGCYGDGWHGFWEAPTYQCSANNPSIAGLVTSCSERPEL